MGLDIGAYSNIKLLIAQENGEGETIFVNDEGKTVDMVAHIYPNTYFKKAADQVVQGGYSYEGRVGFRAGSYSGYGDWRSQLEGMVVDQDSDDDISSVDFKELINFSDCEGVIGPVTSAKLALDFEKWNDMASKKSEYFYSLYVSWHNAFKMASKNGCVSFM